MVPVLTNKIPSDSDDRICLCSKCHHRNIVTAKFCGCCGASLSEKSIVKDRKQAFFSKHFHKPEKKEKIVLNPVASSVTVGFSTRIKLLFSKKYKKIDIAYRIVLMTAAMLILFSGAVSCAFFYNTDLIRISKRPFNDVPLDHPVYSACSNMIKIQAIGFRQSYNLAPYENISVAEWNYAVSRMAAYYGMDLFNGLKLPEKSSISVELIRNKLNALGFSGNRLSDIKRFNSFKCLEEALAEAGCVI